MSIGLIIFWIILTLYIFVFSDQFNNEYHLIILRPQIPEYENVHNENIRTSLTNKYKFMYKEAETDLKNYGKNWLDILARISIKEALVQMPDCMVLQTVKDSEEIYIGPEKHVFGLVWYFFNKYNLDKTVLQQQLRDCVEEHVVCTVGRISRYINSLTGIGPGILGEQEITPELMFQAALRETQIILQEILQRDNLDYNSDDLDLEPIKKEISDRIMQKYPEISERVPEMMSAIN